MATTDRKPHEMSEAELIERSRWDDGEPMNEYAEEYVRRDEALQSDTAQQNDQSKGGETA